jgi:hypothetical protein
VRFVLLAACAASACVGPPAHPAGAPAVTLGTGDRSFIALDDGGPIQAFMGPQGGFHVFLTMRASGLEPGDPDVMPVGCAEASPNPCVDFVVFDEDVGTALDAFAPLRLGLAPSEAAPGEVEVHPSRLVQLHIDSLAEVVGHHLRVTGTITDATGASANQTLELLCHQAK